MAGLGNPGRQYAQTRHNVGFRVVELLRDRWSAGEGRFGFGGWLCQARPTGPQQAERTVVLFEPHTYMNCSGRAVRQLVDFHKADCRDVLAVLDDMALPLGRLRMREQGSAGGHKGLGDILAALGTDEVPRLRVGIGAPPPRIDATDFVLQRFRDDEAEPIDCAIQVAADAAEDWLFHGAGYVMDKYNRKDE